MQSYCEHRQRRGCTPGLAHALPIGSRDESEEEEGKGTLGGVGLPNVGHDVHAPPAVPSYNSGALSVIEGNRDRVSLFCGGENKQNGELACGLASRHPPAADRLVPALCGLMIGMELCPCALLCV